MTHDTLVVVNIRSEKVPRAPPPPPPSKKSVLKKTFSIQVSPFYGIYTPFMAFTPPTFPTVYIYYVQVLVGG